MFGLIIFLIMLGYVGFQAYVFFAKPEVWEKIQERKHQERMAKLAEEEAKRKAAAGGLLVSVAKAVLLGAVKGKRHN
jgi:hypothetical protein